MIYMYILHYYNTAYAMHHCIADMVHEFAFIIVLNLNRHIYAHYSTSWLVQTGYNLYSLSE